MQVTLAALFFFLDFLTPEDGTVSLTRNFGKELTLSAAKCPRRAQILFQARSNPCKAIVKSAVSDRPTFSRETLKAFSWYMSFKIKQSYWTPPNGCAVRSYCSELVYPAAMNKSFGHAPSLPKSLNWMIIYRSFLLPHITCAHVYGRIIN